MTIVNRVKTPSEKGNTAMGHATPNPCVPGNPYTVLLPRYPLLASSHSAI